jgi:ParB-like chromosome segregation protein Spo0J
MASKKQQAKKRPTTTTPEPALAAAVIDRHVETFRSASPRSATDGTTPRRLHPLDRVEWVDPATLRANDYNPNRVFSPEMRLLALSIMTDGWTQPVVATPDGEIVDGFHRWTLARTHAGVIAASGGLVPVVRTSPANASDARAATVRHNRARGQHGIVAMGAIVRSMREAGLSDDQIGERLGMEDEEVERLADERPQPSRVGQDSFGRGWVPDGIVR